MDKSVLLVSTKNACCGCNALDSSEGLGAVGINTTNPTIGMFVAYQIILIHCCCHQTKIQVLCKVTRLLFSVFLKGYLITSSYTSVRFHHAKYHGPVLNECSIAHTVQVCMFILLEVKFVCMMSIPAFIKVGQLVSVIELNRVQNVCLYA
jgi:hypothetical protein